MVKKNVFGEILFFYLIRPDMMGGHSLNEEIF
jgi:hypothetical protein